LINNLDGVILGKWLMCVCSPIGTKSSKWHSPIGTK